MKFYFASSNINDFKIIKSSGSKKILISYHYFKNSNIEQIKEYDIFLDSGAYSAWSKGAVININNYISFIKKYDKYLNVYAVLDDINCAKTTWQNQKYMQLKNLKPLPCFHYGELEKTLEWYVKKYDYIALGGMVPISTAKLKPWLDNLWDKYLTADNGTAKIKVHGFGMTSIELLNRYPWYSVDSTSWKMTGVYGVVFCNLGGFTKLTVSEKGNVQDTAHWHQLLKRDQEKIEEYFTERGYAIKELMKNYTKRDEVNIKYFLDLEKRLTKNPPKFKKLQYELFDIKIERNNK